MSTLNLDKLAAERAQEMVRRAREGIPEVRSPIETLERLATKTLGVLQEQGVYAMLLFLFSRTSDEEKVAPVVRGELFNALKELPGFKDNTEVQSLHENTDAQRALETYSKNVLDERNSPGGLDTLLLIRDLYEKTLIYTRFGAKAAKKVTTGESERAGG
jgi:hypothetical protein